MIKKKIFWLFLAACLLFPLKNSFSNNFSSEYPYACGEVRAEQPFYPQALIYTESSCCQQCDKSIDLYYYYASCDGDNIVIWVYLGPKDEETTLRIEELSLPLNDQKQASFETKYTAKTIVINVIDKDNRITVEESKPE